MIRRMLIGLCPLAMLAVAAAADDAVDHRAKLAAAYHADRWADVDAVRFIYNLEQGERRIARSWVWEPKTNRITFRDSLRDPTPVTFDRDELTADSPERLRQLDALFDADSLRLLLPMLIATTDGLTIDNGGYKLAPLGRIVARELIVTFPDDHPFHPGRQFKLYVDEAHRINQWSVVPAENDDGAVRSAIWVSDEQAGPVVFCSRYRNNGAKFHLWYADVAVKTAEADRWRIARTLDHRCRTCP